MQFTTEAIESIHTLSHALSRYISINDYLSKLAIDLIDTHGCLYDRYVFHTVHALHLSLYIVEWHTSFDRPIEEQDVLTYMRQLLGDIVSMGLDMIPFPSEITALINGYPESLLERICCTNADTTLLRQDIYMMKESLACILALQKAHPRIIPHTLIPYTTIPLVGHIHSPLNNNELETLYKYIGVRKESAVHILLQSLRQMGEHFYLLRQQQTKETLIDIIHSGWMYILFIGGPFVSCNNTEHEK